ncbi:ankyrin repeat-containing domain protein [Tricharina praecox]|uniref:ankyrin repeat-containing domain protein n=1 Tax=Tricharina praecox TaxID=43433 RepID=UPI0022210192|nr:ankyrin repeat-containing domain protein [Tricharina praecox]KAI5856490.1 ankyrin repeat-containing domain protein [Tricharina praecox]
MAIRRPKDPVSSVREKAHDSLGESQGSPKPDSAVVEHLPHAPEAPGPSPIHMKIENLCPLKESNHSPRAKSSSGPAAGPPSNLPDIPEERKVLTILDGAVLPYDNTSSPQRITDDTWSPSGISAFEDARSYLGTTKKGAHVPYGCFEHVIAVKDWPCLSSVRKWFEDEGAVATVEKTAVRLSLLYTRFRQQFDGFNEEAGLLPRFSPLHRALKSKSPFIAKAVLNGRAAKNVTNAGARTQQISWPHIVDQLFEQEGTMETRDSIGRTPLLIAARYGSFEMVSALLNKGADPAAEISSNHDCDCYSYDDDDCDCRMFTPLIAAITNLHTSVAILLIKHLRSIGRTTFPKRALLHASSRGLHDVVALLLEDGVSADGSSGISVEIDGKIVRILCALTGVAYGGHTRLVEFLLERGVCSVEDIENALWIAILARQDHAVDALLRTCGANTIDNYWKPLGGTLLEHACREGSTRAVKLLLDRDTNPNFITSESTVLQDTCRSGHESIVDLLLQAGAEPNAPLTRLAPAAHERTDLQAACGNGHQSIAELLLWNKADVDASTPWNSGRTALQAACEGGHGSIVELLLRNNANINADPAAPDGRTALQAACEEGHESIVELLLRNQAEIACKRGHKSIVELLLRNNAEVNAPPAATDGRTALQAACEGGHGSIVELLLLNNADVNAPPAWGYGRTALQAACGNGHISIVELLLQNNSDVNADPAMCGRTALQAACERGHESIVELLLQNKAKVNANLAATDGRTALQAACGGGHGSIVELLLRNNAEVNADPAASGGRTALQAACEGGHRPIVELLLRNNAEVNAPPAATDGRTALQAACEGGHMLIVSLLLRHKAEVNAAPAASNGRTALQATCEGGHGLIAKLLPRNNADAACEGGHKSVVEFLLRNGADVGAEPAMCGRTALQAACEGGHAPIVELLLLQDNAGGNADPARYGGIARERARESIVEL